MTCRFVGWLVPALLVLAPSVGPARASSKCEAHDLPEAYPRLYLKRATIDGQAGTYHKADLCLPEPVILRVEPCDSDEHTYWCCKGNGATPVTVRYFGDVYAIRWDIQPGDRETAGYFVGTHGLMSTSFGGDNPLGNETVVYYPPWKLSPGESVSVTIEVKGDDGPPGSAPPGQDDPPISPACPPTPPSPPPPDYNPTLTFRVDIKRDGITGRYDVKIVPPETPTCQTITSANVPPCPILDGIDCGCSGQLRLTKGSDLIASPQGQALPIEMCQGMNRPMRVDNESDFDGFEWKCDTSPTCETTTLNGTFRDAISHLWTPSDGTLGSYLPSADGESPVLRASLSGGTDLKNLTVDYRGMDGTPAWCPSVTGSAHYTDPVVKATIKVQIRPPLDADFDAAADETTETCHPGKLLCKKCGTRTALLVSWPAPPPGSQVVFKVHPAGRVRIFQGPTDAAAEILPDTPISLTFPATVYLEGQENGPAMIQVQGVRPGDVLMALDTIAVLVLPFDLDADSDNDAMLAAPQRTSAEDQQEEQDPGKILAVNDDGDEGRLTAANAVEPDNVTPQPLTTSGVVVTDEMPSLAVEVGDDTLNDGATITLTATGSGQVRVIALGGGLASAEVPLGSNLRDAFFRSGGAYVGWPWLAEGLQPGRVDLHLKYEKDGASIEDVVRLAVAKVEPLKRHLAQDAALVDWPALPSGPGLPTGLVRSARFALNQNDRVLLRVTAPPGIATSPHFAFHVTSDADGTGVNVLLAETAAGTYDSSAPAEQLALRTTSSGAAPKALHVIDEEVLTFDFRLEDGRRIGSTRGVMADRSEGAGGGINVFYGAPGGDRATLLGHMWGAGAAALWPNGDLDVPPGGAGAGLLQTFLKNAGTHAADSAEADLLWISSHGCENGILSNNPPHAPVPFFDPAVDFGAGDWNGDLDWAVVAACLTMNSGTPCTGLPGPPGIADGCDPANVGGAPFWTLPGGASLGQQRWETAAFRGPRPLHAYLGGWCQLPGSMTPQLTSFWNMLENGQPVLSAYQIAMNGGPHAWAELWIGATTYFNYGLDTLHEVQRDASLPAVIAYARYAGNTATACGRAWSVRNGRGEGATDPFVDLRARVGRGGFAPAVRLRPPALRLQPGFPHTRFDDPNGETLLAGTRTHGPGVTSSLTADSAQERARAWLRANLPEHAASLAPAEGGPVVSGSFDPTTGVDSSAVSGWVFRFRQEAMGIPLHDAAAVVMIVGDDVDGLQAKLSTIESVEPGPVVRSLDPEVVFAQREAHIRARVGALPSQLLEIRSVELVYADGRAYMDPLPVGPRTARLSFHYQVALGPEDASATEPCRGGRWSVVADAATGEVVSVTPR